MEPMKTLEPSVAVVSSAKVTVRDPKGLQFMSILEAAYNKAGLSEDEAQRVNEAAGAGDLLAEFIEEHRHRHEYSDEEVESSYGYLSGYKPLGIVEQTNRLRELFSGLGYANQELLTQIEKGEAKLPENAEGWFAIPNWKKNPKIFGSIYSSAVQKILNTLSETRKGRFYNYRDGAIDEKHLRQSAKSEDFWKNLAEAQGDADILLVPAQFGIRHRGRSVRRARVIIGDTAGEAGLGTFAVGSMLLTHPNRLEHYDDLYIDTPGDEFSPVGVGVFSGSPIFYFGDDELRFDTSVVDYANDFYGSASGFSPQNK